MRNSIRLANIFVVCLLVISVVGIDIVLAQEKFAPAGSKQGPEIFVQLGHLDSVHSVVFSPDGKYCKGRYGVDFVEKTNKPRRNLCLV